MIKVTNERRAALIDKYYRNKIKNFEILIDNVYDSHNVFAVARSADGLGIEKINLYYTYNSFPDIKNKGKKSSSTANKWIKYNKILNLNDFVKERKKEGFVFVGLDVDANSSRLDKYEFPKKCILVFGSEREGISNEIRKICDKFLFIPMVGMVESYNISVACALTMYEVFKQKGKELVIRENKIDNKNIK